MSDTNEETGAKTGPVTTLRDGSVKASVWENEGKNGSFHSVTFARTYRDKNGEYADAHRFSGTDLLKLSKLAEQSYDTVQKYKEQSYADQQRAKGGQSQTRTQREDR